MLDPSQSASLNVFGNVDAASRSCSEVTKGVERRDASQLSLERSPYLNSHEIDCSAKLKRVRAMQNSVNDHKLLPDDANRP